MLHRRRLALRLSIALIWICSIFFGCSDRPSVSPPLVAEPTPAQPTTSPRLPSPTPGRQPLQPEAPTPTPESIRDADTLYVIDQDALASAGFGVGLTIQALQGLANRGAPRIFVRSQDGEHHDDTWLGVLTTEHGLPLEAQDDPVWFFERFAQAADGLILYDSERLSSINVALSLSGPLNAVPADTRDSGLISALAAQGLMPLMDVSDRDGAWLVQSEYWSSSGRQGLIQLHPFAGLPNPRDWGVARSLPFFYHQPGQSSNPPLYGMANAAPGAVVYGWGYTGPKHGEDFFVAPASAQGLGTVAADQAGNLSVYARVPVTLPLQPPPSVALPPREGVHYVTLIMSDGDNAQVILNKFAHPGYDLYAGERRGHVPIGWTLPPTLAEIAPPILAWIYRQATPLDGFLAGPSGAAYVYPSLLPDPQVFADETGRLLSIAGLQSVVVMDYNQKGRGYRVENLAPLTALDEVKGLFFVSYDWADPHVDDVLWSNGKPVFPMLRMGYVKPAHEELEAMATLLNARRRDPSSPAGYTAVYAHLWATSVSDLAELSQRLHPDVVVVRPDLFLQLAAEQIDR